jgi:hypothetical protein
VRLVRLVVRRVVLRLGHLPGIVPSFLGAAQHKQKACQREDSIRRDEEYARVDRDGRQRVTGARAREEKERDGGGVGS